MDKIDKSEVCVRKELLYLVHVSQGSFHILYSYFKKFNFKSLEQSHYAKNIFFSLWELYGDDEYTKWT